MQNAAPRRTSMPLLIMLSVYWPFVPKQIPLPKIKLQRTVNSFGYLIPFLMLSDGTTKEVVPIVRV